MHPLEFTSTLLSYMRQIALGMHCFVRKSYVHRDLAARNVLMSGDGTTCKVQEEYGGNSTSCIKGEEINSEKSNKIRFVFFLG